MFNNEHISLSLSDNGVATTVQRKSIWRWWNQLSRFQRNLLYVIIIALCFTLLYFLPNEDSVSLVSLDVKDGQIKISPISSNKLPHLSKPDPVEQSMVESQGEAVLPEPRQPVVVKDILEEPPQVDSVHDIAVNDDPANQIEHADNENPLHEAEAQNAMVFNGPTNNRQKAVVAAFKHAWTGYRNFAWGHDHLRPISGSFQDWFGLGLTIVDALDTIYIMGLKDEFSEAREWIMNELNFDKSRDVNLFEITIRVLGGLLSTYHLSGDEMFLEKAIDLGERLLPCFETDSGVPFSDVNLASRKAHSPKWSPDSSTSEVTTLQLEFRDLSRCSGDHRFEDAVSKVSLHVHGLPKTDGLVPIFINAHTGQFRAYSTITLGARGDSYYEYLIKQWLQTGKTVDYLRDDYMNGIAGILKLLVRYTPQNKLLYIGELLSGGKDFKPKMDHLTCYLPGTLALGVRNGMPQSHMKLAEGLLNTCYLTYAQQPTFLAPEITYFNIQEDATADMYVKTNDAHNLLRPEFIESLWYFYQLTGNTTYQDWGWQIFQSFEKYTRVMNGYTSIGNVRNVLNTRPRDMMESFFLGETLKYFYLLFSDNPKLIDLDKYVFNSEAHPLPVYTS